MKISKTKMLVGSKRLLTAILMLCLAVLALSACGKKEKKPTESNPSSTVSIYYKDDVSSDNIYDDIISDNNSSAGDNLADDATPELIIPSDKPSGTSSKDSGTSSESSSHQSPSSSSSAVTSSDAPENASSSVQQGDASSKKPSSSSTSSYDKGYTKPY